MHYLYNALAMSISVKIVGLVIVILLIVWGVSYMGKGQAPAEQASPAVSNEASVAALDDSDAGIEADLNVYDTQLSGLGSDRAEADAAVKDSGADTLK